MSHRQNGTHFTPGTHDRPRRKRDGVGGSVKREEPKVIGDYEIIKTLGHGSFGKVKLARHKLTGLNVAMKFLSKKKISTQEMRDRVHREIQYLGLLKHAHIIKLYDVIQDGTDIVMVIEYLKGELFDYIVQVGKMPESDARRFFQQIVCAVEYCHNHNIVHRDLKPENLLLDSNLNVKIADFGLSNIMRDGDFLKTSCGSPNYAAPEVISGKLYAGPEIDIWSCGVILYVMMCGKLPFDDDHIPMLFKKIKSGLYSLPPHLSPGARNLLTRMLVVDPNKRITIAKIRRLEWFNVGLPDYLRTSHAIGETRRGNTSDLDATGPEEGDRAQGADQDHSGHPGRAWIEGVGIVDQEVVDDLCGLIGNITSEKIWNSLTQGHDKNIRIAYQLARDRRRMEHGSHLDDCEALRPYIVEGQTVDPAALIPAGGLPGSVGPMEYAAATLNQPVDGPEIVLPSRIRILDTSLPWDEARLLKEVMRGQTFPLRTANMPMTPADKENTQLTLPKPKKMPRAKWHFGIRSKSPPMTVMLEIYRTLQALGFEFKKKLFDVEEFEKEEKEKPESERRRRRKVEEMLTKKAQDLYFLETRIRVDNVMVRMDLQLYQMDSDNYLVDFRNLGYRQIRPPSPEMPTNEEVDMPLSPLPDQTSFPSGSATPAKSPQPLPKPSNVSSPFLFLDTACKLINELAVGS